MRPGGTQAKVEAPLPVYWDGVESYNSPMRMPAIRVILPLLVVFLSFPTVLISSALLAASDELQVEVTTKGLGKEVVITQGAREWFMMIEVTPENTVILRQEKDHDRYLIDESETHDRPLAPVEVDGAINDYVNSVKARASKH